MGLLRLKRHRAMLATAGALALCAPMTARAQDAPPSTSAAEISTAAENAVGEVIVTANRRRESMQRVPVAVSAFSAEALAEQQIQSVTDLLGRVPSLNVAPNGTQRSAEGVTIRGQGQTYLAPVGVVNYFAEVPLIQGSVIANQGGPGNFLDLESVQILRGPQGTLFGKNTTGGALLFGPAKPTNELGGHAQVQVGNYDDQELEFVLNLPLVDDKLMVRLAAQKVDRDGYTSDVGTDDVTLSLPFQGAGFTPVIIPNSGLVLAGGRPNAGIAGLPGVADTRADFEGKHYDDRHFWTARLGILYRPTESVENYLVGYYTREENNGTGQVLTSADPTHPSLINLVANAYGGLGAFNSVNSTISQAVAARQQQLGPRRVSLNTDQFYELKTWALVDTLNLKLNDQLTFRNIIGYQRMEQSYAWDLDGSYLPLLNQLPATITAQSIASIPQIADLGPIGAVAKFTDASLFTEEPQLQGTYFDGKLVGVLGAFYSEQKPEGLQGLGSYNAATPGNSFISLRTISKAIYAQASTDLGLITPSLENLKLTTGVRHTWDSFDGRTYAPSNVNIPVSTGSGDHEATTWTAGLDYRVAPRALVFGKVTRGYKAGGFNLSAVSVEGATFGPEFVTSYEVGAKTDFLVGETPVRFNASAYRLDYEGIQRANGQNVPNGCGAPGAPPRCAITGNTTGLDQGAITYNAGSAKVEGLEFEVSALLFRGFELSGSYSYTNANYENYYLLLSPGASAAGPQVGVKQTCDGPVAIPTGVGASPVLINLSCAPFPFTPKNQYAINARYELELGEKIGALVFNANFNHADRSWTAPASLPIALPEGYVDAYDVINASVEWRSLMGSNVDARLFVTNLTDETYRISNSNVGDAPSGYNASIYNEPRMYGLSLRYRFNG